MTKHECWKFNFVALYTDPYLVIIEFDTPLRRYNMETWCI